MSTPIPQNLAEFSLERLVFATAGTLQGSPSGAEICAGVTTDTREDLRGKVFVALRGERFDGHSYLVQAASRGARVLVVDRKGDCPSPQECSEFQSRGVATLFVEDTLVALGDLARDHRARWGGRLCAVVGSAGKTTTRSVVSLLLNEIRPGQVHSTVGNLNNRIGVPMILLGLGQEHRFAVVELGTNQPGEVAELSRIAQPDVAVLTLIDLEHTEGLGGLDGVEREEGAVFSHLREGGTKVGFGDDARVLRVLSGPPEARTVTYGFELERDVLIRERDLASDFRARLVVEAHGQTLTIESPLVGRPGALAVAAGVSATEAMLGKVPSGETCSYALRHAGEPGRNQVLILGDGRYVVDDTYNSNPASVPSSILTGQEMAARTGGRLWLVLGEMLELGSLSAESHQRMGQAAARAGAEGLFFVQGDAQIAAESAAGGAQIVRFFAKAADVVQVLAPLLAPLDVVVVKASRGVRAERVVEGLATFYPPEDSSSLAQKDATDRTPSP